MSRQKEKEITVQIFGQRLRKVVQAVAPEAEELLTEKGGKVVPHGEYIYEEYLTLDWPTVVLYWPPGTFSAYVSPQGQEDAAVIFAVFLLPECSQELHMQYDYRLSSPNGSIEEFFTLRIAKEHECILREAREEKSDATS